MTETPTGQGRFVRLPGLLRRWEIERVLAPGADYYIEEAGVARDGTPLFAVYRSSGEASEPPSAKRRAGAWGRDLPDEDLP